MVGHRLQLELIISGVDEMQIPKFVSCSMGLERREGFGGPLLGCCACA